MLWNVQVTHGGDEVVWKDGQASTGLAYARRIVCNSHTSFRCLLNVATDCLAPGSLLVSAIPTDIFRGIPQ